MFSLEDRGLSSVDWEDTPGQQREVNSGLHSPEVRRPPKREKPESNTTNASSSGILRASKQPKAPRNPGRTRSRDLERVKESDQTRSPNRDGTKHSPCHGTALEWSRKTSRPRRPISSPRRAIRQNRVLSERDREPSTARIPRPHRRQGPKPMFAKTGVQPTPLKRDGHKGQPSFSSSLPEPKDENPSEGSRNVGLLPSRLIFPRKNETAQKGVIPPPRTAGDPAIPGARRLGSRTRRTP